MLYSHNLEAVTMTRSVSRYFVLGGFCGQLAIRFLLAIAQISLDYYNIAIPVCNLLLKCSAMIALIGFIMIYKTDRNVWTLTTSILLLLSVSMDLFVGRSVIAPSSIIYTILGNAYLLAWAYKLKETRTTVSLMLVLAFSWMLVNDLFLNHIDFGQLIRINYLMNWVSVYVVHVIATYAEMWENYDK